MTVPLVALTGATGFIGRHLLKELPKRGYKIRVLLRRPTMLPPEASGAVVGDLAAPRNMSNALAGVDAVIHSAGLAHGMSGLPEDDFRAINTEATVGLARAAARAGVRRFVFLSSIRAQSGPVASEVLTEDMEPRPTDAYGRSKLDAERGLADVHIDWVAMRPVLVYGPGVKGNMAALVKLAAKPLPLPFGSLPGRRSLLSVDNLVVAVDTVLRADAPLQRPLIVAEPEALTIAEMITSLRRGLPLSAGSSCCSHEAKKLLRSRTSQRSTPGLQSLYGTLGSSKSRRVFLGDAAGHQTHCLGAASHPFRMRR